jgi:hypothetical protein
MVAMLKHGPLVNDRRMIAITEAKTGGFDGLA